jgi:uncharacterized cupredoxin-like copper-binding protein
MTPIAAGLRSPAGYGFNPEGDIFYTENQGDWVGSGRMTHLEKGDFAGNAESLKWTSLPGSPVKLKPGDIPSTGRPLYDIAQEVDRLKAPAIWFPHGLFGISTSGFVYDSTKGRFGPFENQLLVGDQGQSKIMRVALEKVKGQYQGVVFGFREGFSSGILRLAWGNDGALFAGMTSRGWSSTGQQLYSLQRLAWTGKLPFEMKTVRAMPDGFEIEFTMPVDKQLAANPDSYKVTGFNYKYHATYGSPVINSKSCPVRGIAVSEDGLKARLVIDSLRLGYIHEIVADVKAANGKSLLHSIGYYTLNAIPEGAKLDIPLAPIRHDHSTMAGTADKSAAKPKATPAKSSSKAVPKRITTKPASWGAPDQIITMGTKPGLKFSVEQLQVKAGSKIQITFNNDDDMLHNFVVVNPGMAVQVGENAMKLGLKGEENNWIPQTPDVLFHTKILQPHTKETIYFIAPTKPGDYTFVCTIPGHFYSMQGVLRVTK